MTWRVPTGISVYGLSSSARVLAGVWCTQRAVRCVLQAEDAQRRLMVVEFAIFSELRGAVLGVADLVLAVRDCMTGCLAGWRVCAHSAAHTTHENECGAISIAADAPLCC